MIFGMHECMNEIKNIKCVFCLFLFGKGFEIFHLEIEPS